MKIAVIIPTHCLPPVIKLTVGSLLKAHPTHDLNIHLGVHTNYDHYSKDLSLFEDLRKVAHIHLVDEIDWVVYNAIVYRYSQMHATNIHNLLKQIKHYEFDHVLLLDNDVHVKADFITELTTRFPKADLIGSFFDGRDEIIPFNLSGTGEKQYMLPKIAVWHVLFSRRLYDRIMENPSIIYPREMRDDVAGTGRNAYLNIHKATENLPLFVDTFADVLHHCRHVWKDMQVATVPYTEFDQWAHHFFTSSFNYGWWAIKDKHGTHVSEIVEIYNREFPKGLTHEAR
jgi:hypothetical protein